MIIKGEEILQVRDNVDIPPPYSETSLDLITTSPGTPDVSSASPNTPSSWPTTQDVSSPSSSSASPSADLSSPRTSTSFALQHGLRPPQPPPVSVQRTSCVSLRQENWVLKGQYVLDPYLPIPEDVRALSTDAATKNMSLACQNGNINAEVWIVGGEDVLAGTDSSNIIIRKASLEAQGQNGFVTVRVNADHQHPFDLKVSARNGGVTVALPSSFSGPLTTTTQNGWVTISSALAANVTTFSDVRGAKKCFVGDFASSGYGRGPWDGSSLEITCTNGRIKLSYVDEVKEKERPKAKSESSGGFLTRMFSTGSNP